MNHQFNSVQCYDTEAVKSKGRISKPITTSLDPINSQARSMLSKGFDISSPVAKDAIAIAEALRHSRLLRTGAMFMEAAAQIAVFLKERATVKVEQVMSEEVLKLKRVEMALKGENANTFRLQVKEKARLQQLQIEERSKLAAVFFEVARRALTKSEFHALLEIAIEERDKKLEEQVNEHP